MTTFAQWLRDQGACREGYAAHHHQTEQEFWASCQRADWMLWVAARKYGEAGWPDHIGFVRFAAAFARGALQYAGPLTDVSRAAIEAAEAFADNPCEETRVAALVAWDAARDAWAAGVAAGDARAAWAAGAAAWAARAAGAARATWAAGDAGVAARAAAGDAANRDQADEIRRIWPTVGRGVETSSDPTKYATHVTITTEEE